MKAIIQNAKLSPVNEIWKKHKPQGLGFSDTDAITLKIKTETGDIFFETFYCRLKGDGTAGHSITKASEKRQQNLHKFIRKYVSKDKKYNVRENLSQWKGREVEIEEADGSYTLKL